ncbi:hypothetical protein BsWGS_05624 [Bradybaena similaris]
MAMTLQVLCPNGRRQNVQFNPNTKLLQILEEVCQRQGFIPPEDYKLVQSQGRKELDLSLSVRYSSLPNNAKLDLVKCVSARVQQDVTIALQLDSGQRLQDNFKPSANLWDILLHLENTNREYKNLLTLVDSNQMPALHPVCIFMREEIIGQSALVATTLKKLGLTSGKAIIRLLHRPVEDKVLAEIENKIEKEKQKQTKLEEMAIKKNELRLLDEMEKNIKSGDDLSVVNEETTECSLMETGENPDSLQITELDSGTGVDNSEPMQEAFVDSFSASPESRSKSKLQSSAVENSAKKNLVQDQSRSQQQSAIDVLRNLNIPGVEIYTPDDFHDLTPQEQAIAQRLMQRFLPGLQSDPSAPPTGSQSAAPAGSPSATSAGSSSSSAGHSQEPYLPFVDFKFPEETRGMDLISGTLGNRSQECSQPCDRESLVYRTEELLPTTSDDPDALPDDFFEVTQADVKVMYRDLQNAVRQLEEQPLMTKAMRQAQVEALFDQYERTVIRVQFPERFTLQGLFQPREPVAALYAFVKEHLSDPNETFYLYTAPPKQVLNDKTLSLAACHLAPAALVYCGSESQKDHLLSSSATSNVCKRLEAEAQVSRVLGSNFESDPVSTTAGMSQNAGPSTSQAGTSRPTMRIDYASSSASTSLPSGAHVPKWLKLSM